jgi:hypothetical protein
MPKQPPEPEPCPLAGAFARAYQDIGEGCGHAHSKAVMRRVFVLAKSFRKPSWFDAPPPRVSITEYVQMVVMSEASDAESEAFIAAFHAQHCEHPFPVALYDPLGRIGR